MDYDYTDDVDLDRLLQIDDEMQKENTPIKVSVSDVSNNSKREFEYGVNNLIESDVRLSDRKRFKSNMETTIHTTPEPSEVPQAAYVADSGRTVLHKRIPFEGDYISVTFSQGNRYYIKISEYDSEIPDVLPAFESVGLIDEANRLLRLMTGATSNDLENQPFRQPGSNFSVLWTTKYAPANYLDLISDEATNRTLLRWLKAWDPYVFGTPTPKAPPAVQSNFVSTTGTKPTPTTNQPVSRVDDLEKIAGELDPRDGLPRYRLVLLAGCPGLGKTTLAHLLAQHAGYQVIEINASDERTVTAFKDQLNAIVSSSTSLNAATGGNEIACNVYKPCCLILDEIDGALPAAVELLANAAKNTLQPGTERRGRGKRNASPLLLRRPVICICNDLFASAVRPLRAPGVPCLVLRLPTVDLGRLVARLDIVARKEGLPSDKIILTQLAEFADRDVRACLNAMQFLKCHLTQTTSGSDPRNVSLEDLNTMIGFGGGLKDVQRSLFDVWRAVFTIPPARLLTGRMKRRGQTQRPRFQSTEFQGLKRNRTIADSESTLAARLQYVMEIVESASDAQPVAMGIFENYLNSRMKDSSLNVARQASNWFVFHDLTFRHIHSRADYSMLRYTSFLPAWFHLALATPSGLTNTPASTGVPRSGTWGSGLHWPTAHTEANTKRQQCTAILDHLFTNQWTAPSSSQPMGVTNSFRFLPRRRFLLDVAPSVLALVTLVASSLRPLNAQLYSQQEKIHLAGLVDLMLSLGLDFSPQQNTETGEIELHLNPELDHVVCFGTATTGGTLRTTAHTTKQLIARELAVERMRRSAHLLHTTSSRANSSVSDHPVNRMPIQTKELTKTHHSTDIPTLITPSSKDKTKVKRDFFGRPIVDSRKAPVATNKAKDEELDEKSEHRKLINQALYYRFREGYSNAVRRPVTMKHFL